MSQSYRYDDDERCVCDKNLVYILTFTAVIINPEGFSHRFPDPQSFIALRNSNADPVSACSLSSSKVVSECEFPNCSNPVT